MYKAFFVQKSLMSLWEILLTNLYFMSVTVRFFQGCIKKFSFYCYYISRQLCILQIFFSQYLCIVGWINRDSWKRSLFGTFMRHERNLEGRKYEIAPVFTPSFNILVLKKILTVQKLVNRCIVFWRVLYCFIVTIKYLGYY